MPPCRFDDKLAQLANTAGPDASNAAFSWRWVFLRPEGVKFIAKKVVFDVHLSSSRISKVNAGLA